MSGAIPLSPIYIYIYMLSCHGQEELYLSFFIMRMKFKDEMVLDWIIIELQGHII